MKYFLPILIIILLLFAGCDKPEELPSFVHIEKFTLTDNPLLEEGSLTEKIEYAHVYIGKENLGVVRLPITLPVLTNGENDVKIDPVVKKNGIAATLGVYPFFKRYRTTIHLTKSKTDTLHPVTSYIDDAVIHLQEDFESNGNAFVVKLIQGEPSLRNTSTSSFEGKSGIISFSKENFIAGFLTSEDDLFSLTNGKKIWVELDFKTTTSVLFGIIGHQGNDVQERLSFGVNPNEDWEKIYFDFTDDVIETHSADGYQFMIKSGLPVDGENFTSDTATVLLDNIKLISF